MTTIPAYIGASQWNAPPGWPHYWRPNGRLIVEGANPPAWTSRRTLAARMFVGLNVGRKKAWTEDDVFDYVKGVWPRGASFVFQRGLWPGKGRKRVEEDSVQVIFLNLPVSRRIPAYPDASFRRRITSLAEKIARDLHQEKVVVEIQVNGVIEKTMGIVPKKTRR